MSGSGAGGLFGRQRRANLPVPVAGGVREKRAKRYTVKVSAEEQVQLEARAVLAGSTVSRLLFEAAMDSRVETVTDRKALGAELLAVQRLLANIANNTNQLARFANSEGQFPAEAELVVAEYRALVPRIREAVERIIAS